MRQINEADIAALRNSEHFDAQWYLEEYPDVKLLGMDPAEHYLWLGEKMGRKPSMMADPPPPPVMGGLDKPLDVLFVDGTNGTSSTPYRVHHVAQGMMQEGWRVHCVRGDELQSMLHRKIDVRYVVFVRSPLWSPFREFADKMRAQGAVIVFDIDDLVFDEDVIPHINGFKQLSAGGKKNFLNALRSYREFILYSDFCTVATNFLVDEINRMGKPAFRVRNTISTKNISFFSEMGLSRARRPSPFIIGYYSGTKTHQADFAVAADALIAFMAEHEDVTFRLVGDFELDEYPALDDWQYIRRPGNLPRVTRVGLMQHDAMVRDQTSCDLIIAPLETDNPFCEAKSELKFFEASLTKCPVIASSTRSFVEATQDGRFARLATTSQDWLDAFRDIYYNYTKARQVASEAYEYVCSEYNEDTAAREAMIAYEGFDRGLLSVQVDRKLDDIDDIQVNDEESDAELIRNSEYFDAQWYIEQYPDVEMVGMDPAEHYLDIGARIGRNPSTEFNTKAYLDANKDVVELGINPLIHYITWGKEEGRIFCSPYTNWVERYDTVTKEDISAMRAKAAQWESRPLISIIMPVYNTPEFLLREAIDSVLNQAYENWELCIADDCSPLPHVRRVLAEYAGKDSRIKISYRTTNGHISAASNSAIEISTGEWIALFDHDDVLVPHALYCMAHAIISTPGVKLLYSDEDKLNLEGLREDPYFKCDWNLELFRSHNLITHLGVYHRSLVEKVGGFRTEFDGAQDYDFALRCVELLQPAQIQHLPFVLYHWRMTVGSTALSTNEKPYAMLAGERALNEHYERLGVNARAELMGFGFKTTYGLGDNPPLASIIIPTRNAKELVEQCINSILIKTVYLNYEIVLVDNGSDDPAALAYFSKLETDPRIRVIKDDRPFNYSALNNNAVRYCNGEIIVLLNNDTEVISPDWMNTLIGHAVQPGVGAVGAKLLYPDDRIQHGGVIMGMGGVAGHAHHRFGRGDAGFKGRLALANEYSAVTAACLAVKKEYFVAVGGLNETDLTIAFNDVDLCLKLKVKGLRNIYTPHAELYHHESATRGYEYESPEKTARFEKEQAYMLRTWGDIIAHDPAYNPNLTLDGADFGLASQPRVVKPWPEAIPAIQRF